jgi:hypothetical protein
VCVTRADGVAVYGGALEVRKRMRSKDVLSENPIQSMDNFY